MKILNGVFLNKVSRAAMRKVDASLGRLYSIQRTLDRMPLRPYELHLELTNVCNANCVFCPHQFQKRVFTCMPDEVSHKAVTDLVPCWGAVARLRPNVRVRRPEPRCPQTGKHL